MKWSANSPVLNPIDPHIKYLTFKCNKVIAHTDYKETLLTLYCPLIRSKFDYGCFIYRATRKTYLKELDTIHHQGPRLNIGTYSTVER